MTAMSVPFSGQLVNFLAALLLLIAFAMLSQRRIVSLIHLYATQGFVLAVSTLIVAHSTNQVHLVYSALLTLALKVVALPWLLHRLIERLNVRWDVETLINIPTTMIVGIGLNVNDELKINIPLEVGATTDTVNVTESTTPIELGTPASATTIEGTQVRELALNTRNYEQLVALMPGVAIKADPSDELFIGNSSPPDSRRRFHFRSTGIATRPITGRWMARTTWTGAQT